MSEVTPQIVNSWFVNLFKDGSTGLDLFHKTKLLADAASVKAEEAYNGNPTTAGRYAVFATHFYDNGLVVNEIIYDKI